MVKTLLISISVLSLIVWAAPELCHAAAWRPDDAMIKMLEGSIKPSDFPRGSDRGGAPVVADYARYYASKLRRGHRILYGEFLFPNMPSDKGAVGVHIVFSEKDFPAVEGGGCGVVHVVYDVGARRLLSLTCNGAI